MEGKSRKKITLKEIGKEKLILLAVAGIVLILCQIPWEKSNNTKLKEQGEQITGKASSKSLNDSEQEMEERLAKLLSSVAGAGKVEVMITYRTTSEKILKEDQDYEKKENEENDASGGTRKEQEIKNARDTIYETNEYGNNVPYIVKEISPQIEGVAVIAEGGENPTVVENIKEIVSAVMDVEAHKISVAKMKE